MKYGCFYKSKNSVEFITYNPDALSIDVLLFKDAHNLMTPAACIPMSKKGDTWTAVTDCTSYNYYKYQITHSDKTVDQVSDIWALCCSPDSVASQIIDINKDISCIPQEWKHSYINPFKGAYTDAIIYEMHIVDWCRAVGKDGKFLNLTDPAIISHLKEMGVTHVQLLPSFDYAQTNDDPAYNWGYNPYHYNVPEGRYVQNMKDGSDAVNQFRQMIAKFHQNGIAVTMDVVYNHTSGTGCYSLYDKTIPKYFYRLNEDGTYSDGSGCGNELATNIPMVKEYVIQSLVHWMQDYHINGFRFDLMGVHEIQTMKEIYQTLQEFDPNVMVYGEPWCGGPCRVQQGSTKENIDMAEGVACFNDNFRDAIKGAEFGGFKRGQVQGEFNDEQICIGLTGSLKKNGGFTDVPGRSINYVECHDNYTLYDKLHLSMDKEVSIDSSAESYKKVAATITDEQLQLIKKQDILSAAYVFLAQGTCFLNGGQDFMRTKQGNPDSYSADFKGGHQWTEQELTKCNAVDFTLKEKNADVFNAYKGLSLLRRTYPAAFGGNEESHAVSPAKGVTKYTTHQFTVYFNANRSAYKIDSSAYTCAVDVTKGTLEKTDVPSEVPALGFLILE